MAWRKSPQALVALFSEAIPPDARIEHRKMFGYPAAFINGNLFAGLHQAHLFPEGSVYFHEQKEEAAISRLYGGIHYRSDIEVGKEHGTRVAAYTLRFAKADGAE